MTNIETIFKGVPSTEFPRKALESGIPITDALVTGGLCKSKSEAKRLIASGGVYVAKLAQKEGDF